jgi:hypothetical protein
MQYRQILTLGAALAFVLVPQKATRAQSGDPVGVVQRLQGDASTIHSGNSAKTLEGMTFFLQDRLVTGARARLQIMLTDDTQITLGENAEAVVMQYQFNPFVSEQKGVVVVEVSRGAFLLTTGRTSSIEVKTALVDLTATGTEFWAGATGGGNEGVAVFAGTVEVSNEWGSVVLSARAVTQPRFQPGFDRPDHLIERLPLDRAAALLGGMSADRRADIFRRLPELVRSDLMARLDPSIRRSVEQAMAYPPMSAGSIMTTEFVSMPATWTVEQALQHIRAVGGARETVYALYVLDPGTQRLLRAISLRQLILSDRASSVLDAGPPRKPITVAVSTDREDVARLISKYDLLAVPVVDDAGRVLGIVTVDDVIDAIVQESTEDVQKLGGMEPLDLPYM